MHRLIVIAALLAAVTAVVGTAAPARGGARRRADSTPTDFSVTAPGPITVGAGEPFGWEPAFSNCAAADSGGSCPTPTAPQSLTWTTTLPPGVTLVHSGWPGNPGLLDNCLSNCPYTFGGVEARSYDYTLVAGSPGDYQLSVAITSTSDPDPNTANNAAATKLHVVPLSLRLTSAGSRAPRAGKRFVWALGLVSRVSGAGVRPDKASCSARIGEKHLRGRMTIARGDLVAGTLACAVSVPAGTAGQRLIATAQATLAAATASLHRTFRIRT